jgi:uncharacterized membrane protein
LIQGPEPFDCFFILYPDKSIVFSVIFTISIALLLLLPSTYSEKNNSTILLLPSVVVAVTAADCEEVLFALSFAEMRIL